jgi:hypothetical protein
MRLTFVKAAVVLAAAIAGVTVYAQGQGGQAQGQAVGRQGGRGGPPQNLQVLPKDWTLQQVQQQMRTFTAALGVECLHCHVGTMAERSKDDNPKKSVARQMLRMTMALNKELADVGDPPAPGAQKVTCFTCHRGSLKPLTAPPAGGGN